MKKILLTILAVAGAGSIGITAPANATPPCQINWELQSDGLCHPYYSTPANGYDPYDPSGQGFLRGYGPDSSWEYGGPQAPQANSPAPYSPPPQVQCEWLGLIPLGDWSQVCRSLSGQ